MTMARVFITGSTDGLGRAAAQSLLADGHEVVLHARSAERAAAVADLAADALGVAIGDLESAADTTGVAEQVNAIGRMDAVIRNAGIYRDSGRGSTPRVAAFRGVPFRPSFAGLMNGPHRRIRSGRSNHLRPVPLHSMHANRTYSSNLVGAGGGPFTQRMRVRSAREVGKLPDGARLELIERSPNHHVQGAYAPSAIWLVPGLHGWCPASFSATTAASSDLIYLGDAA
jgi:hypothetical protein